MKKLILITLLVSMALVSFSQEQSEEAKSYKDFVFLLTNYTLVNPGIYNSCEETVGEVTRNSDTKAAELLIQTINVNLKLIEDPNSKYTLLLVAEDYPNLFIKVHTIEVYLMEISEMMQAQNYRMWKYICTRIAPDRDTSKILNKLIFYSSEFYN